MGRDTTKQPRKLDGTFTFSVYEASQVDLSLVEQYEAAENRDLKYRVSLAADPQLMSMVQIVLANDEEAIVRLTLAQRDDLTTEAQIRLARDSNMLIRLQIASSPNLSPAAQVVMAEKETDSYIKQALASNPVLIDTAREKLAIPEASITRLKQ